uniref:intraflagellar transport protein 140 homolog n=1 Tax=Oncorhynchus gorbuscha TaxID=8017 RepID=UPI001EAEC69D|nr:intraflagellar transport protein 140 homolog [Oncorhynchus gorbuscha]
MRAAVEKVHCVNECGRSSPVLSVDGSTQKLFYLKRRDILEIMKTLLMSQYTLGPEGGAPELMKVKLSGKSGRSANIVSTETGLSSQLQGNRSSGGCAGGDFLLHSGTWASPSGFLPQTSRPAGPTGPERFLLLFHL